MLFAEKKSDPIRNKMDQKEYVKACVKAKKTREINDAKLQVKGIF